MYNMNSVISSDFLKSLKTKNTIIRIDMAFCDPITGLWYKSDSSMSDSPEIEVEIKTDNEKYVSILSMISDTFGVPINYLIKHQLENGEILDRYSFSNLDNSKCSISDNDVKNETIADFSSDEKARLNECCDNHEKFIYIQQLFAQRLFRYTKHIRELLIFPKIITFRGCKYLTSFFIISLNGGNSNDVNINAELDDKLKELAYDEFLRCLSRHMFESNVKSAKAAIMSRNMSHNLGSHVMFYIKQKLQSVSKIVDSKVLDNIIPGTVDEDDIAKDVKIADVVAKVNDNKDIELPFLVGLGQFINYLQERQDYIATIATDYIPANSTISFKDFVYDELKPELRYERHHPTEDSRKNDAGWQPGNLLLDYIAYSEGYCSCDDIKILFGEFDGTNPQEGSRAEKDFKKLREFNIAVPGGVIGRQAIFSIFENIIRNAAKHSERRSDNKLVLQLLLLDIDKDKSIFEDSENFCSKLYDDTTKNIKSVDNLFELYKKNSNKYHFLRIKVDMPNPKDGVEKLIDNLAEPYLEDNGSMKESSKGLKEIRISSAWLRGYSIDTIIPSTEPPAISVYSELLNKNEDDDRVTISYILCIPKPCRVAFVKDEQDREYKTINEVLGLYGCKVFVNPFNLKKTEERDNLINEIANYEIVCMPKHLKEQLCPLISSRYIVYKHKTAEEEITIETLFEALKDAINDNTKDAEGKKTTIDDIIGSIYERWFDTTHNFTSKLVVADDKAVQHNKKNESGSLDSNVILTTTGKVEAKCRDNASVLANNELTTTSTQADEVTREDFNGAIVYSTHFKGLAGEKTDYSTWLQNAISIESVTGNNSTARLIRQDKWTKEWKTKLISAGRAKVAIFDERIFSSFISRKSKARQDGLTLNVVLKKKEELKNIKDFKNYLEQTYNIESSDALKLFTAKGASQIEKILNKYLVTYSCEVAQKNHERCVWAFDIRVSEADSKEVIIVGYNTIIGDCVGEYKEHKSDAVVPIAKITYDQANCIVVLCGNEDIFQNRNSKVFDYITIHQGVLDKIYTAFGIKERASEKLKVTNALHLCFSKHETPQNPDTFLPNLIIHSGRSKPSTRDMPQKQPFVQFAAVDYAVKDCKYTLVELLATAHYEK